MLYSFTDLVWLFFIYSFAGWLIEVCYAAVFHKKFVNRGFVSSPLCPIYGFGAVLFAVFLQDLTAQPLILFFFGMLLATVLEYSTGMLMEKIFKKKLWDYSNIKYNLSGYVCVRYSLLWGALAVVTMLFTNQLLCDLIRLLPHLVTVVALWTVAGLLLLDFITTAMAVLNMEITAKQISQLSEGLQHTSKLLENRLTASIQRRMQKSFPSINKDDIIDYFKEKLEEPATETKVFAAGCSFYKLISLFFIGAFLGDITETIFCLITMKTLMSRSSVVYGPFSIVWGLGCMLLTLFLYRYRNKSDWHIFWAGTLLGGAYEYICSVFTEMVFGTVFWDYSGFTFNLGGRINLLYCFFWGIAAVVWLKIIYPRLSNLIEKLPVRLGKVLCNVLIVFMIFNVIISSLALARYTERNTIDPDTAVTVSTSFSEDADSRNALEVFLDEHFPNERMERIYPNAKLVK